MIQCPLFEHYIPDLCSNFPSTGSVCIFDKHAIPLAPSFCTKPSQAFETVVWIQDRFLAMRNLLESKPTTEIKSFIFNQWGFAMFTWIVSQQACLVYHIYTAHSIRTMAQWLKCGECSFSVAISVHHGISFSSKTMYTAFFSGHKFGAKNLKQEGSMSWTTGSVLLSDSSIICMDIECVLI